MSLNSTPFIVGTPIDPAFLNSIPRGNQEQIELQRFRLPLSSMRYADGDPVNATGAAGDPKFISGGWGNASGILQGEDAHGTTKTETVFADFAIPESYDDGEDIQIAVTARVNDSGAGTMSVKSIDVQAFKIAQAGSAGADICATDAQTITGNMVEYTFELTASGISRGDLLRIFFRIVITESGGTGAQKAEIGGADALLDIRG